MEGEVSVRTDGKRGVRRGREPISQLSLVLQNQIPGDPPRTLQKGEGGLYAYEWHILNDRVPETAPSPKAYRKPPKATPSDSVHY